MKDKIIMLVLGILIGAVVTAGIFLLLGNNNSRQNGMGGQMPNMDFTNMDMENFVPGEGMPEGGRGSRGNSQVDSTTTQDNTESNT